MGERLPGLDALRVGLILLGIPFHAALPYATDTLGLVHSDRSSQAVAVIVVVLRTLRMPTFFLVAGFFAAHLLRERPARTWIRDRFIRLLVPLAFAAATIVPLQRMIATAYREASGIWIGAPQPTFHHLWFLVVLFAFCLLVVAIRPQLDRAVDRVVRFLDRRAVGGADLAFLACGALVIVWELAIKAAFDAGISPEARLAGTTRLAAIYLPWFLFGYGLGRVPGAMVRFGRPSPLTLALATVFLVIDVAVAAVPNIESGSALHLAAWAGAAWAMARVAVGLTARLGHVAGPFARRLGDWTMPIYILHSPWTLAAALLLLPTHWPAEVQFVLVTILAALATWASCIVVDRIPVMAVLLNGRRLPPLSPHTGPSGGFEPTAKPAV